MARPARTNIVARNLGQAGLLELASPGVEIARVAGVSPPAVTHWRNGAALPDGFARRRLALRWPELEVWLWDIPAAATPAQVDHFRKSLGARR
ncbi:MAG: hypothetical protein QM756_24050 [Polyangiaceae bacterium]